MSEQPKKKKFYIKLISDSIFSISSRKEHVRNIRNRFEFTFPEFELVCTEQLDEIEGRFVFKGLVFESIYPASDLDTAVSTVYKATTNILNMMTLASLASWRNLSTVSAYEANKNQKERDFYAYFYPNSDISVNKSIRVLNKELLEQISTSFDVSNYKNNVLASLHQFNKALQAETDVDEFLAYWTGIEYLKQPLYTKKGYTEQSKYYDCPHCNEPLNECPKCQGELAKHTAKPGELQGVREMALDKIKMSNKEFNNLVKIRGNLIHGGAWDKFSEAFKYKNVVRELLINCIGFLLDLKSDTVKNVLAQEHLVRNKATTEAKLIYNAKVTGIKGTPSLNTSFVHPEVLISGNKNVSTIINEDGSISIGETNIYTHKGPEQAKWNSINKTLLIHKKSGAKNLALHFGDNEVTTATPK